LIVLPQCEILVHRGIHCFDQQPTHHGVALLADGSGAPPLSTGILARIQPEITHQFSAAGKARHRTDGQHERKRGDRPDAWMGHQENRIVAASGFFQNCAIQFGDRSIHLLEQFQKLLPPPAGPGTECQTGEFCAALLGEQFFLPAQALAHRQEVQLVPQHGAQAHQLVTVPEQLPEVAFGGRGNPDFRKAFRQHQIENEPGVALIGLLLAHFASANFRGVSDPKFVAELREQTLEPVNRARSFDAHAHRFLRTLQASVESVCFAALVVQAALAKHLAGLFSGHGNLLIACMKITTYNDHRSAPFFRALVG
jgi:hypothetical protein